MISEPYRALEGQAGAENGLATAGNGWLDAETSLMQKATQR